MMRLAKRETWVRAHRPIYAVFIKLTRNAHVPNRFARATHYNHRHFAPTKSPPFLCSPCDCH